MPEEKASKGKKNDIINELEGVVDVLSTDMITALDIKNEKNKLMEKIKDLKSEKDHMRDMIRKLEDTKEKLEDELQKKTLEEDEMKEELKSERERSKALGSENTVLARKVGKLTEERENLNQSLDKTNEMLLKLKEHIREFDLDLKE